MSHLTVGRLNYANVLPLYHGLDKYGGNFDYLDGTPSQMNVAIREGRIDVAPCSSIEYAAHQGRYKIVPNISISSLGSVRSVLFVSNKSFSHFATSKVWVTGETNTSVVLLKIIARIFNNFDIVITDDKAEADGCLYIGDTALEQYHRGSWKYKYDLGSMWYELTTKPFVYALWIFRACEVHKSGDFISSLMRAKEESSTCRQELVDRYLGKFSKSEMIEYWDTISYELFDEHMEALNLFYRYACEIGEIKSVPKLEFV